MFSFQSSKEQRWPSWIVPAISFLVMGAATIFVWKWLFFIPGAPKVYTAEPLIILATLGMILFSPFIRLQAPSWKAVFRKAWPFFAFFGAVVLLLVISYLRQDSPPSIRTYGLRWWFNNFTRIFAIICAFVLGLYNRKTPNKAIAIFMLVTFSIVFVLGFGEFLQYAGYANPVGKLVLWINTVANKPFYAWTWTPIEAPRAQGLAMNPAIFGFISLCVFAWVLSSPGVKVIRIILAIETTIAIYISGTRAMLLVMGVMLVAWAIKQIAQRRKQGDPDKSFLKSYGPLLITFGIVVVVGFIAFTYFGNAGVVARLGGQLGSIDLSNPQTLEALGTGRGELWINGMKIIAKHPFGTGLMYTQLVPRTHHAHNDIITLWVWGGILLVALFILLFVWMAKIPTREGHSAYPLYFGIAAFGVSLFNGVFSWWGVLTLGFFLLGAYCSTEWIPSLSDRTDSSTR